MCGLKGKCSYELIRIILGTKGGHIKKAGASTNSNYVS